MNARRSTEFREVDESEMLRKKTEDNMLLGEYEWRTTGSYRTPASLRILISNAKQFDLANHSMGTRPNSFSFQRFCFVREFRRFFLLVHVQIF